MALLSCSVLLLSMLFIVFYWANKIDWKNWFIEKPAPISLSVVSLQHFRVLVESTSPRSIQLVITYCLPSSLPWSLFRRHVMSTVWWVWLSCTAVLPALHVPREALGSRCGMCSEYAIWYMEPVAGSSLTGSLCIVNAVTCKLLANGRLRRQ